MGKFSLINDDCLAVMDEMIDGDIKIDFSFTSPPYNRKANDKYNNFTDINKDYEGFLQKVIDKNLKISKYMFLNVQKNYYNKKEVMNIIGKNSHRIIDIIIWNKSNPMPSSGCRLTNSYEFIIILSDEEKSIKTNSTYIKNSITTTANSNNKYKKIHRATMNPEVSDWFIETFTKKGDSIIDCFMGLGTTGISAVKKGRNFVGVELDEEYCNIAKERIEKEVKDGK